MTQPDKLMSAESADYTASHLQKVGATLDRKDQINVLKQLADTMRENERLRAVTNLQDKTLDAAKVSTLFAADCAKSLQDENRRLRELLKESHENLISSDNNHYLESDLGERNAAELHPNKHTDVVGPLCMNHNGYTGMSENCPACRTQNTGEKP